MLAWPVDVSPYLARLTEEKYDSEIRGANRVVLRVPYLNSDRTIAFGILVSERSANGEQTISPGTT